MCALLQVVERPKIVEKNTITEQPVIQQIEKVIYITREVPVERIVEKQVVRKVVVERITEQVCVLSLSKLDLFLY